MRRLVLWGLLATAALCCILIGRAPGSSDAAGRSAIHGTWMAGGPGCGGRWNWVQRPSTFPYFCDGIAVVEEAQWRDWGSETAKAKATMNEAVLTGHSGSAAEAPRQRSAVTIVASHIERCGSRRIYRSVVIRFDNPRKGQAKPLRMPGPPCPKPPAKHPSTSRAAEFIVRPSGGFISCGMYGESAGVICESHQLTAEGEEALMHIAKLRPDGTVVACSQHPIEGRCQEGNAGSPIPTYSAGKRVKVGRFACDVLGAGVQCTVAASGKGFLITPSEITPAGS
ncbi:MAG: hypothetical protein ACRDLL_08555 [Solirubrobacterales bacterium]